MPSRQRGFTLIEVLVAFAVAALSLAALLQVFSTGLKNAATSKNYAQATMHAESMLAHIGVEEAISPGVRRGAFVDGYRWTVAVTPFDAAVATSLAQAFDVVVTVAWGQEGGAGRSVSLRTLRLAAKKR